MDLTVLEYIEKLEKTIKKLVDVSVKLGAECTCPDEHSNSSCIIDGAEYGHVAWAYQPKKLHDYYKLMHEHQKLSKQLEEIKNQMNSLAKEINSI